MASTSPQTAKQPTLHDFSHDESDSGDDGGHNSPDVSPTGTTAKDNTGRPIAPVQKRRRVTRACDECRRKKIKCDGKQPCTHCTVYSYDCTYDQPSNRRRNATPQYIEALEQQLRRADAIVKLLLPSADLSDPHLEQKLQSGLYQRHTQQLALQQQQQQQQIHPQSQSQPQPRLPLTQPKLQTPQVRGQVGADSTVLPVAQDGSAGEAGLDSLLESMVRSTGQLDLDEQGHFEYHGHSSGLSFVRRMREQLGDVLGPEGQGTPFVKSRPMQSVYDSPRSSAESPFDTVPTHDLPSREVALELCDIAVNDATALMRFVHWPTFEKKVHRAYDTPADQYGNEENTFLPLLYATLSLGTLFSKTDNGAREQKGYTSALDQKGYMNAIGEGFRYFRASRQLMDIADCRDTTQLQAIVFMILFLQGSAKLSVCYAYIGVALRSALRMGLHRSFPENFTPIENETRKRLFWVIRKMDVYVGALLGLPHTINAGDIDQEYPLELDDEYITETEIKPMPSGRVPLQAASNAHTDLVNILEKIVRYVYPLKGTGAPQDGKQVHNQYSVAYTKIREIEGDLQEWQDKLPMGLKPGGEATPTISRVQYLLRMAYAHAQMMLYRPFLHYVSATCKSQAPDKRSYACAAACVSVSQNIVHITVEMKKRGLLVGAYWFTMYTAFFAILTLVFYCLENPDNAGAQQMLEIAKEGRDTLEALAKKSMAADRCTATLATLFSQLPDHMSRNKQAAAASRKRRQESTKGEVERVRQEEKGSSADGQPKRANSYPSPMSDAYKASAAAGVNSKAAKSQPRLNSLVSSNLSAMPYTASSSPMSASASSFGNGASPASSHLQHQVFPTTDAFGQQGFTLDDMTSMLFPSNDPFDYPDQSIAPTQSYDQLLKDVSNQGPSYTQSYNTSPQSAAYAQPNRIQQAQQQQRATAAYQQMANGGPDMPLLGPMPMYLMQGGSAAQSGQNLNNRYSGGQPYAQHFGPQWQGQSSSGKNFQPSGSMVPDVNLEQLLGDSAWTGNLGGNTPNMSAGAGFGNSMMDQGNFWMQ